MLIIGFAEKGKVFHLVLLKHNNIPHSHLFVGGCLQVTRMMEKRPSRVVWRVASSKDLG